MKKLYWILWLFVMVMLYIFENSTMSRAVLAVSFIIPCLFVVTAGIYSRRVCIALTLPDSGSKGIGISGGLVITRSGLLLPVSFSCEAVCKNIFTGERKIERLNIILPLKGELNISFDISAEHCGNFRLTAENCRIHDIFGIFSWRLKAPIEASLFIPPEIFDTQITLIEDLIAVIDSDTYSTTKSGFDLSETFAVREYLPGDSVKNIHWKLSQKSDKIMVRELGLPVVNQILIMFETVAFKEFILPTPDRMAAMAEIFFSVSYGLARQGIVHTIGWRDTEGGMFVSREICFSEEIDLVIRELFHSSILVDEKTAISCFCENNRPDSYAHIAVVSGCFPPDIELICNRNRVTVIHPAENDLKNGSDMAFGISFTELKYDEELCALEL